MCGMTESRLLSLLEEDPYNVSLHMDLAEYYLDSAEEQRARDVVLSARNLQANDAPSLLRWARISEALGMARHARQCYERLLRLWPQDSEAHYRLALLLHDTGRYEDSVRHLRKAVKCSPDHKRAKELLAESYRALGLPGQAEVLAPLAKDSTSPSPERSFPPSISKKDTDTFLRLFAGREVGYRLQSVQPETGDILYRYHDSPLSGDIIASHLLGRQTVAGYPLRSDNAVRYVAVLLKLQTGALEANLKNRGYLASIHEKMRHHVLVLARYAGRLRLPAYPEETGSGECRLWFFFQEFVHFLKARRFAETFLESAPAAPGPVCMASLTATRAVGIGWVERSITLPLGIDRGTLRRSFFLDPAGKPHGEQLKALRRIREISIQAAFDRLQTGRHRPGTVSSPPTNPAGAAGALLGRCAVLEELVGKARQAKVLRREEKIVLFYTLGLLYGGGECIHDLLEACPDYHYQKVQRQVERLKPNPVSCLKIRQLIPEITASVGCNCSFDLRGGKYPSPLLHINPHMVPASEELSISADASLREVARRYVNLRRHQDEVQRGLGRLERLLESHFERRGIDRFRVDDAVLHRTRENESCRFQILRSG